MYKYTQAIYTAWACGIRSAQGSQIRLDASKTMNLDRVVDTIPEKRCCYRSRRRCRKFPDPCYRGSTSAAKMASTSPATTTVNKAVSEML